MRTIKFRAKNFDEEWVYSTESFVQTDEGICMGLYNEEKDVIPDTVGQFTGLYDKDGNEIYEGDVVFVDFDGMDMVKTYTVEWSNNTAAFVLTMFPGTGYGLFMDKEFVEKSVKVIGNIYNPKEEDKEYNSND